MASPPTTRSPSCDTWGGTPQVLPLGQGSDEAAERRGEIQWLSDSDVVDMLRELATHRADWNPGRGSGRWSLAGAQAKIALYRDPDTAQWGIPLDSTPTTHILKPAIDGLYDHHINEVLCLRAARRLGLPAADVHIIEADDVQAMASTRYDRLKRADGTLGRLHQEDLCRPACPFVRRSVGSALSRRWASGVRHESR